MSVVFIVECLHKHIPNYLCMNPGFWSEHQHCLTNAARRLLTAPATRTSYILKLRYIPTFILYLLPLYYNIFGLVNSCRLGGRCRCSAKSLHHIRFIVTDFGDECA